MGDRRANPRRDVQSRGVLRTLAEVPLFYKLLVANSLLVILGAVAGTMITAEVVRAEPRPSTLDLMGLFAALGVVISVAVNAAILRVALSPIRRLEATAVAVRAGDPDARAPDSPFADRDVRRLIETFNGMLDRVREHRDRLRRLASEATRAAETERKRIARELHDDTAQRLAALLVRLKVLEAAEDPEARRAGLAEIREQVDEVLEQVRRTALALRPETLEEMGLLPAIRYHAGRIEEEYGVRVSVTAEASAADRLSPDAELALYRIVQEAIGNAARHAGADRITVAWTTSAMELAARVDDDGRGFDVGKALSRRDRLGLFGMKERAAYLGGRVDIDSERGSGTSVRIALPLRGENERRG